MSGPDGRLVFVSAGEASGDHYGAEIVALLRKRRPELRFTGLGGPAMESAGQRRVVRAEDVAVMGITEIVRHVPRIYASYRRLVRAIRRERPAVALLIDFPDVNFRLAKHLRRAGVPVIWFVSPQLWAWKRRRLRWVQERVDQMLVIFPFEERFYQARGVEARFVGHPLAAQARVQDAVAERALYAEAHGLDAEAWWMGLLPGSRWREVEANLPGMLGAAGRLAGASGHKLQWVVPVAPGLEVERVRGFAAGCTAPGVKVVLVEDAAAVLPHLRVSAVASGTATVLAALAEQPFVVVYRVSAMTYRLARALVRYPPEVPAERDELGNVPVGMVNLLAGRRIVPELLNESFTPERLAAELGRLLVEGPERAQQAEALREVSESLRLAGARPVEAVAEAVLAVVTGG